MKETLQSAQTLKNINRIHLPREPNTNKQRLTGRTLCKKVGFVSSNLTLVTCLNCLKKAK